MLYTRPTLKQIDNLQFVILFFNVQSDIDKPAGIGNIHKLLKLKSQQTISIYFQNNHLLCSDIKKIPLT